MGVRGASPRQQEPSVSILDSALATIDHERDCIEIERDAFREFANEIQELSLSAQQTQGTQTARVTDTGTNRAVLAAVRESYRETVMSIPDYEKQYGETLKENLTAEFSEDIATMVVDGHQLTQPIQQLLVQQARQSAKERVVLLDALDTEEQSVRDAQLRLSDADSLLERTGESKFYRMEFAKLVSIDENIQQLRQECTQLLVDRQNEIHRHNRQFPKGNGPAIQSYLYSEHDATFPVLSATLDRIQDLQKRRRELMRVISRKD